MANIANLGAIASGVGALTGLLLVSPANTTGYQPLNPVLPNGEPSSAQLPKNFVFHYEGEQTGNLESDITDHYVEDNTAIQDQIALKPITITTNGFIGELNDVVPQLVQYAAQVAEKLTLVSAYTPKLTLDALIAYNAAVYAASALANAVNTAFTSVASITGNSQAVIGSGGITPGKAQNQQQAAFQYFYVCWTQRALFNIQTPWAVFQNMAIQKLRAIQDADTNVITNFEITFKMINVASTLTTSDLEQATGRLSSQLASLTNTGTNNLTQAASSFSSLV